MDPETQEMLTRWGIPALVLAVGGVLGVVLTRSSDDSDRADEHAADAHTTDLLTEKATVLTALRDLESERDRLSPEAYEEERRSLLKRGAAAMRALDERSDKPVARGPKLSDALRVELAAEIERLGAPTVTSLVQRELHQHTPAPPASNALVWVLAGVVLIAGLVGAMQTSVGDRGEGPMTGRSAGAEQAPMSSQADAQRAHYRQILEQDPANLTALNGLTEVELAERQLDAARVRNNEALAVGPTDPEARSHRALLDFAQGEQEAAFAELDAVLVEHPNFPRAWTYKGLISLQAGRFEQAVEALERSVALQPDNRFLQQQLAMARQQGGIAAPVAAVEPLVSIQVSLDESVTVTGTETVFISIKNPARPRPPLGARKLSVSELPLLIELTTADLLPMIGQLGGVPDSFQVDVRVDTDGNATTRDVVAEGTVSGVSKGATGLSVVLK